MLFLARIVATLTQRERYFPPLILERGVWVHNSFLILYSIFGKKTGIIRQHTGRFQNGIITNRKYFTLEARLARYEAFTRYELNAFSIFLNQNNVIAPSFAFLFAFFVLILKSPIILFAGSIAYVRSGSNGDSVSFDGGGSGSFIIWDNETTGTAVLPTYNGVNASNAGNVARSWGGGGVFERVCYWVNPAAGSYTIGGGYGGNYAVYSGVNTSAPIDALSVNGSANTISVTPTVPNCWALATWNGSNAISYSSGVCAYRAWASAGIGLGDSNGTVAQSAQTTNFSASGAVFTFSIAPAIAALRAGILLALI